MRRANGTGSIVKLSGNRRRPFMIRKTKGFDDKGHPIYDIIGYTETYQKGEYLLASYNNDPWNTDLAKITLEDLFNQFMEVKKHKFAKNTIDTFSVSYKHIQKYAKKKYKEIKAFHMQETIDNCGRGYSTQGNIKTLWKNLDKFALEYDISSKMYSSLLVSAPIENTSKSSFTDREIKKVWEYYYKYINNDFDNIKKAGYLTCIDTILFYLYSGFRLSALLEMKIEDIHLNEPIPYFQGGVKTQASMNRIVPIHSSILELVKNRVSKSKSGYFIEFNNSSMSMGQYEAAWSRLMKLMNIDRTVHECRHTFSTKLDSAGANRVCIDRLMGHSSKSTGERVYTHKNLQELKDTVELIKVE